MRPIPDLSFEQMLAPLTPDAFFAEHFEQRVAIVNRGDPGYYDGLLDLDGIDRFLAGAEHHYPDVYLVDAADPELKPQDYCGANQRIDLRRLYDRFAGGATIVLFGVRDRIPALRQLCRALERRFSHAFDTNIYLTPPNAHGLKPHYDNHDVFVLQFAGSKRWTTYDRKVEMPLPGQSFAQTKPAPGPVSGRWRLEAGDLLYCPRGLMHDAEAEDAISLHVTIGLKGQTWAELMIEAVSAMALAEPEFRRLLPPGFAAAFDGDAVAAAFRRLADRLAAHADPVALLGQMADRFVAGRPPAASGQLGQLLAPADVALDARVGAWPHQLYRLTIEGETVRVVASGATLTLPAFAADSLAFALATPAFRVGDLPGELDDAGRLVLVRRLLREGLLRRLP